MAINGHESLTVVGQRKVNFTTKDGVEIKGLSVYAGKKIPPELGAGMSVEKLFFSDAKLDTFSYRPEVGDEVEILYNRYGRPYLIRPVDDDILA